jgi:uncharacterized protein (TIGR03435 family)
MAMRTPWLALPALLCPAFGQTPDAPLNFDIASLRVSAPIKESPISPANLPTMKGGPGTNDPERITYSRIPILTILLNAFGAAFDQFTGPSWISNGDAATSQKYDIQANVPPGTTKEQAKAMMLNLLKERLGLTYHRETKEFTVYELTIAKGGPKLKPAEPANGEPPARPAPGAPGRGLARDKDGFPELPPGRPGSASVPNNGRTMWSARMMTTNMIAGMLGQRIGSAHVVDKTGLTGEYDFKIEFSSVGSPGPAGLPALPPPARDGANSAAGSVGDASDPAPDIFTAVEKQLGLKLTKGKAPLDVIVIDHIEKVPTEN